MFPYLVSERGPNSNTSKLLEEEDINLSSSRESLPNWSHASKKYNHSPPRREYFRQVKFDFLFLTVNNFDRCI